MKRRQKGSQSGIALFMVLSALGLLSMLMSELTYTTQMNARMAYNYVDNLKAYYMAKAGYKLSIARLKAYLHFKKYLDDPGNKAIKDQVGAGVLDKVWMMPITYPIPIPKDASVPQADAIKDFIKDSKLSGSYQANITGESSKLNLNNLFITEVTPDASSGSSPNAAPSPNPSPTPTKVDFKEVLAPAIDSLLANKKADDREFADVYRNVQGKDVLDALESYLFADRQSGSNLPGYKLFKAKAAPFYSLSELHLIPGIDDEIYNLLASTFTVYSTPGVNVNTMGKQTLMSLIPDLTSEDADNVLRKRDDPDEGKPWPDENAFWSAIQETPSAGRNVDTYKAKFKTANVKLLFDEQSFKINVLATVGLSARRLEAYVVIDPKAGDKKPGDTGTAPPGQPPNNNGQTPPPGSPQEGASAKKTTGVNLIYWRML